MANLIVEFLNKAAGLISGGGDYAAAQRLIDHAGKMNLQVVKITTGRDARASGAPAVPAAAENNAWSGTAGDTPREIYNTLSRYPQGLAPSELFGAIKEIAPTWKPGTLQTQLNRWAGTGSVRLEDGRFIATGKVPEPARRRGRPPSQRVAA